MSATESLIERLKKRAKEDQACADNSAVVADALSGQMALFEARESTGWNTYAVRMAVDHRNSVRRDSQYAADLLEAAAELEALRSRCERMEEVLKESIQQLDKIITDGIQTDFEWWRDDLARALQQGGKAE